MCKGWKNLPSFYPCPCQPSGKRSGLLSRSLSLFSISLSDERGAMIASTTKGRAACVWMRLVFLLSFLLLYYLSVLTLSDLTYSLFPLCCTPLLVPPSPSTSIPALSLTAWCHSLVLLLRSSLGSLRYNQGTELKIRKRPCRRDTLDGAFWCLLGNLKFICCHTSFYSPSLFLSLVLFLLLFSPFLRPFPVKCHHVLFSQKERNRGNTEECKMYWTRAVKALSCLLFFIFLLCKGGGRR